MLEFPVLVLLCKLEPLPSRRAPRDVGLRRVQALARTDERGLSPEHGAAQLAPGPALRLGKRPDAL